MAHEHIEHLKRLAGEDGGEAQVQAGMDEIAMMLRAKRDSEVSQLESTEALMHRFQIPINDLSEESAEVNEVLREEPRLFFPRDQQLRDMMGEEDSIVDQLLTDEKTEINQSKRLSFKERVFNSAKEKAFNFISNHKRELIFGGTLVLGGVLGYRFVKSRF